MDRNLLVAGSLSMIGGSLSARRAWIEIIMFVNLRVVDGSLSARRAWIEILQRQFAEILQVCVALRKESVDRNRDHCDDVPD